MQNKKYKASSISTDGALKGFKVKSAISATAGLEEVIEGKAASDDVALLSLGVRKDGGSQVVADKRDIEIKNSGSSVDIAKYMSGGGYAVDTSKLAGKRGHY